MTDNSTSEVGRRFIASHEAVKALATIPDPTQRDQQIDRFLGWLSEETANWLAGEIKRATAKPERWLRLLAGFGSIIVGLGTSVVLVWLVIDGYRSGKTEVVRIVLSSGFAGALLGGVGGYYFRLSR